MPALVGAWLVVWGTLALAVAVGSALLRPRYAEMGIEVWGPSAFVLDAGQAIADGRGLLPLAAALALGLSPVALLPPSHALRAWLALGVVQSGPVALLAYGLLAAPLYWLQTCMCGGHGLPGAQGALWSALAVGIAQACVWTALTLRLLRLPPGSPGLEALRLTLAALLPSAVAAALASLVAEVALGTRPVGLLVVPPPLAAAGTAVALVAGATLWLRLRALPATRAAGAGCS